jgi:putative flippase GtrA
MLPEITKFGVVGGIGYASDVLLFNVLRAGAGTGALSAKAVSLTVATTVAFVGNRYWTYRERTTSEDRTRVQYAAFLGCSVLGMLIQLCCLWFSHYVLGLTSLLADNIAGNVVGMAAATVFRFWSYRTWVFRGSAEPADAEASAKDSADEAAHSGDSTPGAVTGS